MNRTRTIKSTNCQVLGTHSDGHRFRHKMFKWNSNRHKAIWSIDSMRKATYTNDLESMMPLDTKGIKDNRKSQKSHT